MAVCALPYLETRSFDCARRRPVDPRYALVLLLVVMSLLLDAALKRAKKVTGKELAQRPEKTSKGTLHVTPCA